MKQILQPLSTISAILGTQGGIHDPVKDSIFLVKHHISEGYLFYSVLTKELLFLSEQEYQDYSTNIILYNKRFLVSEQLNEDAVRDQLRAIVGAPPSNFIFNTFTIFPTTECNAHCFYCFEKHRSKYSMSKDTAAHVAEYIIHKGNPNSKLFLRWFGGEPLMNQTAIDVICSLLSQNAVDYSSGIVTNGYLLTNELINKAISLWHLEKVQITLDGTKEVYNRVKAIEGTVDAYSQVINNITYLLSKNIQVRIRLNLDMYNLKDMLDLVNLLINQFHSYSDFLKIYAEPLFEKSGNKEKIRSHSDRLLLYQTLETITDMLIEAGLGSRDLLPRTYKHYQCMADCGSAVVILPDGHLGLCEYFTDSEFFGSVLSDKTDIDMVHSWQEHAPLPECATCPLSPDCIRVKKCIENSICPEERRNYRINRLKKSMENEFREYQNHQESEMFSED